MNLSEKTRQLRERCYHHMFLLDGEENAYVENFSETMSYVSKTCKELLGVTAKDVHEEALICLSVLIGYNVTIRNERNIVEVLNRSVTLLPDLHDDDTLKAHLLVYIYGETEDEDYADEARSIFSHIPESRLSQEDHWALEALHDIEESIHYEPAP